MKLTIKTLEIENFKGVSSPITMSFDKYQTSICGANHTGKTTTMDAVMWLLFGKNSEGSAAFGIDPLDDDGNIIHNLQNRVKATFDADGRDTTLERRRTEQCKKVRGEYSETYSHTTAYFVDGEKMTEKEYKEFINAALIEEQLFKAITNPAYFPNLKAEEQRQLLIKMIGEITDAETAAGDAEMAELLQKAESYGGVEKYAKHIDYKAKEIKTALEVLPAQITERALMRTDLKDQLPQDYNNEQNNFAIAAAKQSIAELQKQIESVAERSEAKYNHVNELKQQESQKRMALNEIARKVSEQNLASKAKQSHDMASLTFDINMLKNNIKIRQRIKDSQDKELQQVEKMKINLHKEWNEVESRTFEWTGSDFCPTCGQQLPQENIEMAKTIAISKFNGAKQADQDRLDREVEKIKDLEENAIKAKTEAEAEETKERALLEAKQAQIMELMQQQVQEISLEENTEYIATKAELFELNKTIYNLTEEIKSTDTSEREKDKLRDGIVKHADAKASFEKYAIIYEQAEKSNERLKELEEQERNLNEQLTDCERLQDIAQRYIYKKMRILEEKANRLFELVEFKMFNTLMNGTKVATCECKLHGTPYQDLSNSEKINAGLDIINALCRYNDTWAPVFIDNAEAINEVLPTDSQQIRLIVSNDKKLTILT